MDADGGILGRLGSSLQEGRHGGRGQSQGQTQSRGGNAGNSGGGTRVHVGNLRYVGLEG